MTSTFTRNTRTNAVMHSANENTVLRIFLKKDSTALAIKTSTPTRMPRNKKPTHLLPMTRSKMYERATMIANDGRTTPRVAKIPPNTPSRFAPINVAVLIAIGPGVLSAIAKTSASSECVSQPFLSTTSPSMSASMAYPPPNENRPILKKMANIWRSSKKYCFADFFCITE